MRLHVAWDLDDVEILHMPVLKNWHNEQYGTNFVLNDYAGMDFASLWNCSKEETRRRMDEFFVCEQFRDPGVVEGMPELMNNLGRHKHSVVTGRVHRLEALTYEQIERYFGRSTFSFIEFTNHWTSSRRPKSTVLEQIEADILIEDSLEQAHEASEAGYPVILVDYPWNRGVLPKNSARVFGARGVFYALHSLERDGHVSGCITLQ
jgi:uncharacterized HAD superfamily protein